MLPRNAIIYKQDPTDPTKPNIPMTPEETAEFWRIYDEQMARSPRPIAPTVREKLERATGLTVAEIKSELAK